MIRTLRILGNVEGVSYLLLLGVAMPLKYAFGLPLAVKIVGMAHGVLFLAYCALPCLSSSGKWASACHPHSLRQKILATFQVENGRSMQHRKKIITVVCPRITKKLSTNGFAKKKYPHSKHLKKLWHQDSSQTES